MTKNSEKDKNKDRGEALDKYDKASNEQLAQAAEELIPESNNAVTKYDLKMPPGLCGEVTKYINSRCRFPREKLAVIAALVTVGNIGGLSHELDGYDDTSSNLLAFCVAGSATGKEAVIDAINELHKESGISRAVHGLIKSEQELTRNLVRHQASYYNMDEIGIFLGQLESSHGRGGASYLQGVLKALMSIYSKAKGYYLVSGDLKEQIFEDIKKEYMAVKKKVEDKEKDNDNVEIDMDLEELRQRLSELKTEMDNIDNGIKNPFISLIGFSTPDDFIKVITIDQIKKGFIGRSIIVDEKDTNPKRKSGFKRAEMTEELREKLKWLSPKNNKRRIEETSNKKIIITTPEAVVMLDESYEMFHDYASMHVEKTGFEAVARRGHEMVNKISFILSIGSDDRNLEAVEWAHDYVMAEMKNKMLLADSAINEKPINAMASKILSAIDDNEGITHGVLINRFHKTSEKDQAMVLKAIEFLEKNGRIYKIPSFKKHTRKGSFTYFKKSFIV